MSRSHETIFALCAALALSSCGLSPALAQDAPAAPAPQQFADPACPKLAEVIAILQLRHETYVVLDATDLLNVGTTSESKILVTTVGNAVAIGYEAEGCVVGPIGIATVVPKVGV